MIEPAVRVQGLIKAFGLRRALAGVDLELPAGTSTVLLGPNGAGKTTLLGVLATLISPTTGDVRVLGMDPTREGGAIRQRLSLLSHRTMLYDDLSAAENLAFHLRLRGLPAPADAVEAQLERVGLGHRADDLVRTFSRGMQQRLALARALMLQPELLLLDEPFSGLDPAAADALVRLLREERRPGSTMLLSTHDLALGLPLVDYVAILSRGRIVNFSAARDVHDLPATYRAATAASA